MAFSISRQPLIITKIPGNTDDTGRLTPRKKKLTEDLDNTCSSWKESEFDFFTCFLSLGLRSK